MDLDGKAGCGGDLEVIAQHDRLLVGKVGDWLGAESWLIA